MNLMSEDGVILLIDKPYDWSSFDVVKKIKYTTKVPKIGHAGTLDPLATGLLILCTGKLTKTISEIQDQEKEYTGQITIGKTTPSYDLETEINSECDVSAITKEEVLAVPQTFIGKTLQTPPAFSAVWDNGRRAYKKARNGEPVDIKPKEIFIKEFEITKIDMPVLDFRVVCSKGTYIRSLAKDFGEALGCGAHLSSLRRTRIGKYRVEDAISPNQFVEQWRESLK